MAWRPHARVKVDARNPRAAGVCGRCGIPVNHYTLRWQFGYAGVQLINFKLLVCDRCEDLPNRQLGAKILSPDPLPIFNARPEPFTTTGFGYDESNVMTQPDPTTFGSAVNGLEMTMPDGTVMLAPDNPPGTAP